jgi:hypothetical protein
VQKVDKRQSAKAAAAAGYKTLSKLGHPARVGCQWPFWKHNAAAVGRRMGCGVFRCRIQSCSAGMNPGPRVANADLLQPASGPQRTPSSAWRDVDSRLTTDVHERRSEIP